MGFTVSEELTFPRFGVSHSGCYVTIRNTYLSHKRGAPSNFMGTQYPLIEDKLYRLFARFMVYSEKPGLGSTLEPLQDEAFVIQSDQLFDDPVNNIYNYIKSQYFANKTCVDDL